MANISDKRNSLKLVLKWWPVFSIRCCQCLFRNESFCNFAINGTDILNCIIFSHNFRPALSSRIWWIRTIDLYTENFIPKKIKCTCNWYYMSEFLKNTQLMCQYHLSFSINEWYWLIKLAGWSVRRGKQLPNASVKHLFNLNQERRKIDTDPFFKFLKFIDVCIDSFVQQIRIRIAP